MSNIQITEGNKKGRIGGRQNKPIVRDLSSFYHIICVSVLTVECLDKTNRGFQNWTKKNFLFFFQTGETGT